MNKILILLPILLAACTSYRVLPDSDNLVWKNGQGFQSTESKTVKLSAAVDQSTVEPSATHDKIFYVEVTNKSKQPILIGPEMFGLRGVSSATGAVNPEDVIAQTTADMNLNVSQAQTSWGDIANDTSDFVASLSHETPEEAKERRGRAHERAERREQAAQQVLVDRDSLVRWQTQAFRRNTLQPGQSVAGFIEFPLSPEEGPLTLDLSEPTSTLSIHFRVIKN